MELCTNITDHRSIGPETFARLIRDSWVGSTGDATAFLRELFGLDALPRDVVIALEEPFVDESVEL